MPTGNWLRLARVLALYAGTLMPGIVYAQTVREVIPPRVSALTPPPASSSSLPATAAFRADENAGQAQENSGDATVDSIEDYGPEEVAQPDRIGIENQLALADVVASLYRSYPLILQARLELSRTQGDITSAFGAYDIKAEAHTLNEPTGFYRNHRYGVGVARQTWWGGYLYSGYRNGRGVFQPWYQELATNEGGEFKLGLTQPLLQGRAIDPQRVAVFQSSIDNRAAQPQIQEAILNAALEGASMYWEWVSAGQKLGAQKELLNLAEVRDAQLKAGVNADKFPAIDLIFNQQLIAERRGKLLEAEQKYRTIGYKLSLFLRDEAGQRIVPSDEWLPEAFPRIEPLANQDFQADLAAAVERRPEPRLLRLEVSRLQQDQRLASNDLLPRLDVLAEGSQDMGTPTSSKNDKGRFELMVGLIGEVPIQRRKARGKLQSTSAKIAQVNQKLRLQVDKIAAELQTAFNNLQISSQVVEQERIALSASLETLSRYQFGFTRGYTDLIYINFLEQKVNEAEIKLIDAQGMWFSALADMQRALGLDPLEQAINVSALPTSQLPGPGHLPQVAPPSEQEFEAEWGTRGERNAEPN